MEISRLLSVVFIIWISFDFSAPAGEMGSPDRSGPLERQDSHDRASGRDVPEIPGGSESIERTKKTESTESTEKIERADLSEKWNGLKLREYDVLPKNRGLSAPHYPASNENRIDLFYEHIKNLGGGYVGVGTDQNFTFIAWARSEYAYLMDFDPVVVCINRIHLHFIDVSPDYPAFRKLWIPKDTSAPLKLIQSHFRNDPDYRKILEAYHIATGQWAPVPWRLRTLEALTSKHSLETFVNRKDDYDYIRALVKKGRIHAVPGNLNGLKTFMNINRAARNLNIPIRVLYTSNAEDYFKSYSKEFRRNILDMPVDDKGLVVRTCSVGAKKMGFPEGELIPEKPYHYNIQPLKNMQGWMLLDSVQRVMTILGERTALKRGISVVDRLPADRKD